MEFNDHLELPEGDFIPGIYNYCNRWCERCIYTDKCMTFASEKIFTREVEAIKRYEKSMEENKDFWDQVNKTIEEAAELIDEEIPLLKNDKSPLFEQWEDDEDAEEAMKEHEEKRAKAKDQDMSKLALKYEKAVHKWFEERKDILKQEYNSDTEDFDLTYPGIVDELVLKQLTESVEVIQWYHIQIWIKINRAISSSYEEEEDRDLFDEFQKDSDGSAMVALKGIDSSIGAWSFVRGKLTSEWETIKPMIRMLLWLKMEVEKEFPNAKGFVWPPPHSDKH